MKVTSSFICAQCSFSSPKWLGKCPECDAWNSFAEEENRVQSPLQKKIKAHAREPKEFLDVLKNAQKEPRIALGIGEVDRVLGGGIVPGSLVLLTGEPGIGKSTLTLQIAEALGKKNKSVLYISGEESEEQISMRASRLGMNFAQLKLLSETNLETVLATASEEEPDFLIVDSIQVMSSQNIPGGAGSVSQVRLCTEAILDFAKPKRLPVLLIGHVTKDGTLAGPRVLEHLVDTVLYLEGDRVHDLRILRGVKNRYGAVSEVGIFEMKENGLQEVKNAASFFVQHRNNTVEGSALTMIMEGNRPLLIEVEALTNPTTFGYPRRTADGLDLNRLQLLLAVLQKKLNLAVGGHDVYANVAGGYRITDPACDLAICAAIMSSFYKKALPQGNVCIGEVSLSGSVRLPGNAAKYKKEIANLGHTFFTVGALAELKKLF